MTKTLSEKPDKSDDTGKVISNVDHTPVIKRQKGISTAAVGVLESAEIESGLGSSDEITRRNSLEALSSIASSDNQQTKAMAFGILKRNIEIFKKLMFADEKADTVIDSSIARSIIVQFTEKHGEEFEFVMELISEKFNKEPNSKVINLISELAKKRSTSIRISSILEKFVSSKGLDTSCLVDWYMNYPQQALFKSLNKLVELEKAKPGTASTLQKEFGINHFGRYPLEMLIDQYNERDEKNKPYGVIMYPQKDETGVFYQEEGHLIDFNEELRRTGHIVRIVEAGSKYRAARALISLNGKYGKISFMILGGHGELNSSKDPKIRNVQLGSNPDSGDIRLEDLIKNGEDLMKFFIENPTIILESCWTGQKGGIKEAIKSFGAIVFAPEIATECPIISVTKGEGGQLQFKVVYPYERQIEEPSKKGRY